MTSLKGVGYGKAQKGDAFYETKMKLELNKKPEATPEENFKAAEKEINALVEKSALANLKGNSSEALEKAKEAYNKEKNLRRQKENANQIEGINMDLSFTVQFNLANQLQANGIYQEALQKYNDIIKSKQFPQAGKLRVNMGNIYFAQEKYSVAIKMYRMAHDLIPPTSKEMRFKILKNIGHSFVKLGQFEEAINTYESIMKGSPDFSTSFNLLLCLYGQGDKIRMKDCFASMLSIEIEGYTEEEEEDINNQETAYTDLLRDEIKEKKRQAIEILVKSAKLIAPVIEEDIIDGYNWIIETLKTSNFPEVEAEVEISKAMAFLKSKNMEKSIETLKSFERKDKIMMGRVATNISFLYFLERDFKNAEKYADIAITFDRFNPKALVNRGNCMFVKNEFLRAKEQFLEAIGVEADCIEALYNLAFALEKLQTIISTPEVVYQMASIHELMGNTKQALKWYQVLLTKVPTDPNILARVGNVFAREDDDNQALHYYSESYKYLPTNIETIGWLGIYYVKQELYERACHFFERASQIQSKEIKWRLMVASCYRRMSSLQKALKIYEEIYQEEPRNIECLKFLTQLCKEMQLPYEQYASELRKLEAEDYAVDYNAMQEQQEYENQYNQGQQQYARVNENAEIDVTQNTRRVVNQKGAQPQQIQNNEDDWNADDLGDDLMPV
ncbi:hypothetical protein IMG5_176090 [Ichthyophthirius multifiliis]|uniref:Tetratricopeptide repeat protein n=1 Tax=Ichthyophthirius multifiliis TaxID=5932 RepID=G0R298_ICHMU|nr:hypothetical protein IMG5_176090 [Ichthyophthirius multifiliis]EGR28423.1 hypothetical protein IMG5_176090 [Ichthyophthirius multifiliis]|eukprot:XP_004029659.1 hypothetical protein IMG5_176090 [Ichthyophthirius multifiliis]